MRKKTKNKTGTIKNKPKLHEHADNNIADEKLM